MIEVNGLAHVILTVSDWEKSRAFYAELLPFLGMKKVYDGNSFLYHVGGRTALGIQRCAEEHEGARFAQNAQAIAHAAARVPAQRQVQVQQHGVEGLHAPPVPGVFQRAGFVHAVTGLAQAAKHE